MAYIYKHLRKDTNEIFYVGISSKDDSNYIRAFSKSGRNSIWKDIVEKYGYNVIIVKENVTLLQAIKIEKKLIKLYGRLDNFTGILSNKSNGGEGTEYTGPINVFDSHNNLIGTYKSMKKAIQKLNPKYIL